VGEARQPEQAQRRAQHRAWALIAVMAVGSGALWTLVPQLRVWSGPTWQWLLLTSLFLITSGLQLHFEIRRESWYIQMAEIPIVLGLFLLGPLALVTARFTGTLLFYAFRRKFSFEKKVFNALLVVPEVATGVLVFNAVADSLDPSHWLTWIAAVLATIALDVVTAALVYLVICLTQGRPSRSRALHILASNLIVGPFNAILAVMVLLIADVSNWALILVTLVFGVLALGYRAYDRILRQHSVVNEAYGFSQFLERVRGQDDALEAALRQVREAVNATAGYISVSADGGSRFTVWSHVDDAPSVVRIDSNDSIVARCLAAGHGIRVTTKAATGVDRLALERRGATEVLAAPLRFRTPLTGHVELWDRQNAQATFSDEDVRYVESLVSHLAAAIENERLVDQLRHEAYHDRLTGLPNRARFVQAVDEAIGAAKKNGGVAAAVLLDLDSFKDVNDALGHDYGDELLIMVGQRLRERTPEGGLAARMGADEFAVLCPARDLGAALTAAQELREAVAQPYLLAGLTVEVGVSIGVSVAPDHAHTGGALMQRADVALTHAKGTGRSDVSYVPSMEQATVHRLQLVTQLREAINAGQVQVHYQPKLALSARELVGVEALVRWQHPEYGSVMPDEFVPLAERTGLIGPLTMHVLKASLIQCRTWLDRDMRIAVAVNLSVKNLLDTAFPESVFALLEEHRVPAELLTFEITESSVMSDPERSLPVLHRLHERGIGLSIDDFGTGYSSLAYLRRLPVDEVKIDKVFVLGMGTDLGDMAIVRAIVELGHSLALNVVAEGVEDELARDLLSGMGCDTIQGFLVSRALTAERLDAWLAARTSLGPVQPGLAGRRPQLTG
jgi:diguanylate cyclase (GGDEF)-like protein